MRTSSLQVLPEVGGTSGVLDIPSRTTFSVNRSPFRRLSHVTVQGLALGGGPVRLRQPEGTPASPAADGPHTSPVRESSAMQVRAELAGNLWKILVREGQRVTADETLMILESMKMEIPVTAPRAGTVKRILVKEGQPVQEGDPLAEIDEG